MTGGESLVASLGREGVEVVFGLPGVQIYGAIAALRDERRIRFIDRGIEQVHQVENHLEALARDRSSLVEMPVGRMSAPRFLPGQATRAPRGKPSARAA